MNIGSVSKHGKKFRVPWITGLEDSIPTVYVHEMQHPNSCPGETCFAASLENFDIAEKVDGYTEDEVLDLIDVLQLTLEHMETARIDESQMRLFP